MKKYLLTLAFVFIACISFAKPLFTSGKYYIACQYDALKGTILPANGEYKMIYSPTTDGKTALDSTYWIIKEEAEGQYSFQNSATHKYIRHDTSTVVVDRWALKFVDKLMADKSTLFTLELNRQGALCYYVIRSVANPAKSWERRTALQTDVTSKASVYPVGVKDISGSNIQSFVFYDTDGKLVTEKVGQTLGSFASLMNSFTIGGKVPVVDTSKGNFFLTVLESQMGTDVTMNVQFALKNAAYSLYIGNTKVESGSDFTFVNVTGVQTYRVEIRNGTTVVAKGNIVFGCLPYVQMYSDATITIDYSLGRLVVTEPGNDMPSEILLSNYKIRGWYAGNQIKKCYAIKLKDTDGIAPIDRSFFGLRNDNSWVLDAMFNDSARMRNRVSTDFWEEFSKRPYYAAQEPNMVNGTRGHFVEVFLNDSYNGLYCMTEKVDRKQTNVKKMIPATGNTPAIQRGVVVKADDWSEATWFGLLYEGDLYEPTNNAESWYQFDAKYPDIGNGEPFDWTVLKDAVNVVTYSSTDEVFKTKVEEYYDMPVFLDYYLFLELLLLTDNHGKNFFVSIYDQTVSPKMTVAPWDLDSSWGRFWDGTSGDRMRPDQSFETFITWYVPRQSTLYKRLMDKNVNGFNDKLKSRYYELRGTYFTKSSIMERFYNYNKLLNVSGAASREMKRWGFSTINSELTYVANWVQARLTYLDKQYLGGPYVPPIVGIANVDAPKIEVSPNPVQNILTVYNTHAGDLVQIISLQGVVVSHIVSNGDKVELDMSQYVSGIYMVKVGSTVVKVIKN